MLIIFKFPYNFFFTERSKQAGDRRSSAGYLIVFSVFTWRHDRHVGAPKQRKGGHVGAPTKSSGNLTLLLCKRFLLFSLKNMAVDLVSENQQYTLFQKGLHLNILLFLFK